MSAMKAAWIAAEIETDDIKLAASLDEAKSLISLAFVRMNQPDCADLGPVQCLHCNFDCQGSLPVSIKCLVGICPSLICPGNGNSTIPI